MEPMRIPVWTNEKRRRLDLIMEIIPFRHPFGAHEIWVEFLILIPPRTHYSLFLPERKLIYLPELFTEMQSERGFRTASQQRIYMDPGALPMAVQIWADSIVLGL